VPVAAVVPDCDVVFTPFEAHLVVVVLGDELRYRFSMVGRELGGKEMGYEEHGMGRGKGMRSGEVR
jgi:hypothetical protein